MTFITGMISNANPGPTVYGLMETALLAQGWTLENTVVIGARTHKILKSAAAGNDINKDWFLDVSYPTTGAGNLNMAPFEALGSGGATGIRGPYATNDTTIETVNYSRYGDTAYAFETNWVNSSSSSIGIALVANTNFVYWVSMTRNRVIFSTSNQNYMSYCGLYIPTDAFSEAAGSKMFPLIVARLQSSSSASSSSSTNGSSAAVTRLPNFTDLPTQIQLYGWGNSVLVDYFSALAAGIAGQQEHAGLQGIYMSPYYVVLGSGGNGIDRFGSIVGYLDGLGTLATVTSAVRGDTVTVDGTPWYGQVRNSGTWMTIFMRGE